MLGGPSEVRRISDAIGDRPGFDLLAGEGPLSWSMGAVRDAAILLGNDSAMLHAAAGFDVPLVGLFGPTSAEECGPYGRVADTLRAPDVAEDVHYRDRGLGDELMRRIPIAEVATMALDRIRDDEGMTAP